MHERIAAQVHIRLEQNAGTQTRGDLDGVVLSSLLRLPTQLGGISAGRQIDAVDSVGNGPLHDVNHQGRHDAIFSPGRGAAGIGKIELPLAEKTNAAGNYFPIYPELE